MKIIRARAAGDEKTVDRAAEKDKKISSGLQQYEF